MLEKLVMGLNPNSLSPEQFNNTVNLHLLMSMGLCVICGENILFGNSRVDLPKIGCSHLVEE
jgi:hypothetical protein